MRKHSEFFGLILIFIGVVLAYFIGKMVDVFLGEYLKALVEPKLGSTVAEFLTRFSDAVIPTIAVPVIIVGIYMYIKNDIETAEGKARVEELHARFDPQDPICMRPAVQVHDPAAGVLLADFYRVRISKEGTTSADDCCGTIISVVRGGKNLIAGEHLQLPFSNSSNTKRVSPGVPDSVDVLAVYQKGYVGVCAVKQVGSLSLTTLFAQPGIYEITVAVSSPQQTTKTVKLVLDWTGSHATSSVRPA